MARYKMTPEERRMHFDARCEGLKKMLDMHMPPALISLFAFTLMENIHDGKWGFLWWHVKHVISDRWQWYSIGLWFFWQRKIRRRSQDEIERLLDEKEGLQPEEDAA